MMSEVHIFLPQIRQHLCLTEFLCLHFGTGLSCVNLNLHTCVVYSTKNNLDLGESVKCLFGSQYLHVSCATQQRYKFLPWVVFTPQNDSKRFWKKACLSVCFYL